jgi:2-hydroxy-3-oxopropionate reductase
MVILDDNSLQLYHALEQHSRAWSIRPERSKTVNRWPNAVGFIGLGIMGGPMAANLVKAGYPVIAHDIAAERVKAVVGKGARRAANVAALVEQSDLMITMVPDSPDVEAAILGPGGVAEHARAGQVVIDMSTISPSTSRKVAQTLAAKGADFLDAPVSGGPAGAEQAALTIMVGGSAETLERCRPVLERLGKKITHVGGVGAGETAKLCNQILIAANMQAVCEGLLVAAKAGLDLPQLIDALMEGSAGSFMLRYIGDRVLARDFSPGFKVTLEQKDLRLCLQLAEELMIPVPGTAVVHQLFRSREAAGGGETEGNQALFKVYESLANFRVTSSGS